MKTVIALLCFVSVPAVYGDEKLSLLSRSNSGNLEKYHSYVNTGMFWFQIPEDVSFVSFKFIAEENQENLFECYPRNVSVFLTRGAPPVINPDGSKFPDNFMLKNKPEIYDVQFKSDNKPTYINLTSPYPGLYYAATFNPYTNPRDEGITQHGLSPECTSTVDAYLYARIHTVQFIKDHLNTSVTVKSDSPNAIYKFLTPDAVDHILISIRSVDFCAACSALLVKVGRGNVQMQNVTYRVDNKGKEVGGNIQEWVKENEWYYIVFEMEDRLDSKEDKESLANTTKPIASTPPSISATLQTLLLPLTVVNSITFHFSLTYFSSQINTSKPSLISQFKPSSFNELSSNLTLTEPPPILIPNITATAPTLTKLYRSPTDLTHNLPYVQHSLLKGSKADSFLYTFDLQPDENGRIGASVNLTDGEGAVLMWALQDGLDVGGTLQVVLGIKPLYRGGTARRVRLPPENHTILACVSAHTRLIPVYPDVCVNPLAPTAAPIAAIVLNRTSTDDSVQIPFPEAGPWFITLYLYCNGTCRTCLCPEECKSRYRTCVQDCEVEQEGFERGGGENDISYSFTDCSSLCRDLVLAMPVCNSACNCTGGCLRYAPNTEQPAQNNNTFPSTPTQTQTETTCNSSVLFDISSYPCVQSGCGSNGKCVYMLSEGFVYSSCSCRNNYKGWDCMDNSEANTFFQVVLELLLLVLSNIMFLPAAFFAYRRRYYAEMVVYLSTCFFSSFYHYCDAGENIVSVCIFPLYALQFCDFYCGLLGIWVTLVAMANVPSPWPSIAHMFGAIILGCGTTYDKQSIWVFVLPAAAGSLLIVSTWTFRYFRTRRKFPSRKYLTMFLPVGLVIVALALLMFATLQTKNNYKYVHSAWHILMAIGVIILLPDETTFVLSSEA